VGSAGHPAPLRGPLGPRAAAGYNEVVFAADVAVLGGGLTGACAALELARAGMRVALIDQDEHPMNRASLRNEGKIHLGFVYAHDRSLATAKLMLDGALSFRQLLKRCAGVRADTLRLSHPFVYLVANDSLLAPDELAWTFSEIEAYYRTILREQPELDYLGGRPDTLFQRVARSEFAGVLRMDGFSAAFRTAEVAVDTHELAAVVRSAIAAQPAICFFAQHTVVSVARADTGFAVEGTTSDGTWRLQANQVVNALWENRFKIDRTVGMEHPAGWLHRLKYRVIAQLPAAMRGGPSVTIVVGPYGDVVVRPDGTAYFSWYPLGLYGWTADLAPPEGWNRPCRGELDAEERRAVAGGILDAIDVWYPGAAGATPLLVDAGAIVAYGRTDVDDPQSGLHARTRVGVRSQAGYHSVDPGKLTTAPLFGVRAAQAVLTSRAAAA
jgi:glycine/D-amino acid oxidase-like deaminating enzyme